MSHGGELFALGEGTASEPNFETALRGYHKGEVEKYWRQAESAIEALAAERDEAYAQLRALASQVQELQMELTSVRRHGFHGGQVTFHHLGPKVEQILLLAEEQAEDIRAGAVGEIAALRSEAER